MQCAPKINFLLQLKAFESYSITDRQTDRQTYETERTTTPYSPVLKKEGSQPNVFSLSARIVSHTEPVFVTCLIDLGYYPRLCRRLGVA